MPSKGLMKMKELKELKELTRTSVGVVLVFQGSFFCRGPMWPPASRLLVTSCYNLPKPIQEQTKPDQTVIYLNGTWQSSFTFVMTKWPNVMRIVSTLLECRFHCNIPILSLRSDLARHSNGICNHTGQKHRSTEKLSQEHWMCADWVSISNFGEIAGVEETVETVEPRVQPLPRASQNLTRMRLRDRRRDNISRWLCPKMRYVQFAGDSQYISIIFSIIFQLLLHHNFKWFPYFGHTQIMQRSWAQQDAKILQPHGRGWRAGRVL